MSRYARKRDLAEPDIVRALRAVGATVIQTELPDLIVGYRGQTHLIEVKTRGGRITESQARLLDEWQGGSLTIVYTVGEALEAIGAVSNGASNGRKRQSGPLGTRAEREPERV